MALLQTLQYGGTNETVGAGYAKINLAIDKINLLGGGTTGQYLKKANNNDFGYQWETTSFATESFANNAASTAQAAAISSSNGYTDTQLLPLTNDSTAGSTTTIGDISIINGTGTVSSLKAVFQKKGKIVQYYVQCKLTITGTVFEETYNDSGVDVNKFTLLLTKSGLPRPLYDGKIASDVKLHSNISFVGFMFRGGANQINLQLIDDSSGALFTNGLIVFQGFYICE